MAIAKIIKLDPRVWGIDVEFIALKAFDEREVSFKDGSKHKTRDFLIADDSASIILNLWDESIKIVEIGKSYKITEARMNVFNNQMKIAMSRKSLIEKLEKNITPNESINMSEKKFKPINSPFIKKKFYKKPEQ